MTQEKYILQTMQHRKVLDTSLCVLERKIDKQQTEE